MRIGIYSPYLNTLTGGEKYILTIAQCLSANHTVVIFWDGDENKLKEEIKRKFNLSLTNVQFSKNIFSKKTSFFSRFWQSRSFDRIIVLSDGSIPFVWPPLYIHFQTPMEWVNGSNIKTKIKLRRVAKVICNSLYTKQYIDKKFNIKSIVIYPPVDIQISEIGEKENLILNVGRYGIQQAGSSYKKQEMLIHTFIKMIKKGLHNWTFVLVVSILDDDKNLLTDLRKLCDGYPIEILSNIDNKKLWDLYTKAKIYWHAAGYGENLHVHPDRAEHFGIATVEAMGVGAVPVVINAGGQKEIIEDNKNGFLWDTEEQLIEQTDLLINDPKMMKNFSEAAKKRAKIFTQEAFCTQWNKVVYE